MLRQPCEAEAMIILLLWLRKLRPRQIKSLPKVTQGVRSWYGKAPEPVLPSPHTSTFCPLPG